MSRMRPAQGILGRIGILALGVLSAAVVYNFAESQSFTAVHQSTSTIAPTATTVPAAPKTTAVSAAPKTNSTTPSGSRSHPDTIFVDPAGQVSSLEAALAAAAPGDIIVVRPGEYHESGLVIDKPLSIAADRDAILVSKGGEQILTIASDGVDVRGLTFRGVSTSFVDDRSAIRVERVSDCSITGNRFEDTFFGIYFSRSSQCTVKGNEFAASKSGQTKSGNGIHLFYSRDINIRDNRITGHRDGIYLEFSSGVTVTGNESVDNLRYGLHFMFSDSCAYERNVFERNDAGVAVMYSKDVTVTDNRFVDNWGNSAFGLLLKDITDSVISRNIFERNTVGIYAEGANRLDVEHNDFRSNGRAIKLMANSMNSVFRGNNFVANTFDVTTNSRQNFSTFTGNYWDAYRGYDLDKDGTGDVPFYPVRLFALIVERHEPASILLRSVFVDMLDAAERVLPTLVPKAVVDAHPRIRPNGGPPPTQASQQPVQHALHIGKPSL